MNYKKKFYALIPLLMIASISTGLSETLIETPKSIHFDLHAKNFINTDINFISQKIKDNQKIYIKLSNYTLAQFSHDGNDISGIELGKSTFYITRFKVFNRSTNKAITIESATGGCNLKGNETIKFISSENCKIKIGTQESQSLVKSNGFLRFYVKGFTQYSHSGEYSKTIDYDITIISN
jgi:hypothetical protein